MRVALWRRLGRRLISWQALAIVLGTVVGVHVDALMTDGPLTPIDILRGRTDENGYLRVLAAMPAVATDGPKTPIGILRGRTDENGYLRVSITAGSNVAPADATYITQTANSQLTAEQALASLATGLMFNTTATGVVSTVACGTAGTVLIGGAPPTCAAAVPLTSLIVAASSAPAAPSSGFTLYGDASGRVAWIRASDGFTRTFDATLTANRVYTLPDADTKFPIASQTLTFSGPTAARTITLPDANFTVARTDAANTFTGTQTMAALSTTGSIASGGNVVATNDVAIGASDQLRWSTNRSRILSPSDGVLTLYDSGTTTFARLQYGGTTSSYVATKRFGNALAIRAADDTVPTFSTLTACASGGEGALVPVSDSTTNTWGATITGTGSNHVLAYCDGTNWTVAGK